MRQFIVQDRDGKEISREQKTTKTGFEKHPDGNFYKKLGDPRCITAKIRAREIRAQRLAAAEAAKQKETQDALAAAAASQPEIPTSADSTRPLSTMIYRAARPVSVNHIESCLSKKMTRYGSSEVLMFDCEVRHKCELDILRQGTKWSKTVMNRTDGKLFLWRENNRSEKADFEIRNAII